MKKSMAWKRHTNRFSAQFIHLLFAGTFLAVRARVAQGASADAFQFFEEESKVVTASRRSQPVREAPVAVDVITAEDIRHSGAVNLWDVMRFRAGMDVVESRSGEGNRAIVSVRGFPAQFVDKLLVLVDGRSVYTALSGGAVGEDIPVQMQDIERIEIVRGPNAALYGSNAGLGVINIITRKPENSRSASFGAFGGNRGLHQEQAAYEDTFERGAYRLSFSHHEQDGFPAAGATPVSDFLFSNKGNFRGSWTPTPRSTVDLFAGGTWNNQGVDDSSQYPEGRFRNHFQMLRGTQELRPGSSLQVMVSRRDDVRTYDAFALGPLTVREYQYDAEMMHRLDWMDGRMHTIYGASYRYSGLDSVGIFGPSAKQKNETPRGFASQSVQVLPSLALTGAASLEHSDTGGTQPAYQMAAVESPLENHTFRINYGEAPTIPTLYQKEANQRATSSVLLIGNPDIQSQKLRSYETGYQGSFLEKHMLVETNLFYMVADNLSQTSVQSFVFTPAPLLTLSFGNTNKAIARGSETKWTYRWDPRRSVYVNYTYETISDAKGDTNVQKGTPPHALNIGGVTGLGSKFSLSLNAGYKDGHRLYSQGSGQTLDIHAYWRLDGRLAYAPRQNWEIFVGCQNMTEANHVEFADGLTVTRTYQGGISVKFGDSK